MSDASASHVEDSEIIVVAEDAKLVASPGAPWAK